MIELELDKRFALIIVALVLLLTLGSVTVVGAYHTPYDYAGHAILLSRSILQSRDFLNRAGQMATNLDRIATELDHATMPTRNMPPLPGSKAKPVQYPQAQPQTLLQSVQKTTHALHRIQDLAVSLENLSAPSALEPVKARLQKALQAFALWGAAVANYNASPSPQGWRQMRQKRIAALLALAAVKGMLK